MNWHVTHDPMEFDTHASGFLRSDPYGNALLLTISAALRRRGRHVYGLSLPRLGWYEGPDRGVSAAFVHTPPRAIQLSPLPTGAAAPLADLLARDGTPLVGVGAAPATAAAFAEAWHARTGHASRPREDQRLYVLGTLRAPEPMPPGAARAAEPADRDLLLRWYTAFLKEIGEPAVDPASVVDDRLGYGGLTLWQVDGVPVSLAGVTAWLPGEGARVGPVYTPAELRGRGFAGAVTTAVSRVATEGGAGEVSLFADLANATSTALYQRLGYRAVADRAVVDFDL